MILSPGRNYIFVHMPKTGGTSLALALEDRAHRDDILIGDTPKARKRKGRLKNLQTKGRLWKHSTLADLDGVLSPDQMRGMFLTALVRNPWDRMVSYYHWLQNQNFAHPAVKLAKSAPFDLFARHGQTVQSFEASPARFYVTDAEGMECKAHFMRLEHLEEDLVAFEAHLGFQLNMPHANRSDRVKDYRSYYTDSLAEHVGKTCAEDIARFGYEFDPGS